MSDPTVPVTLGLAGAAVPPLTIFGVSLGLDPAILIAGFGGSLTAMALLNSVPSTGDTIRELMRTSSRRVGVAVGSALTAGYTTPVVAWMMGLAVALPPAFFIGLAFVVGAGAQTILPKMIARVAGAKSPPEVPAP